MAARLRAPPRGAGPWPSRLRPSPWAAAHRRSHMAGSDVGASCYRPSLRHLPCCGLAPLLQPPRKPSDIGHHPADPHHPVIRVDHYNFLSTMRLLLIQNFGLACSWILRLSPGSLDSDARILRLDHWSADHGRAVHYAIMSAGRLGGRLASVSLTLGEIAARSTFSCRPCAVIRTDLRKEVLTISGSQRVA